MILAGPPTALALDPFPDQIWWQSYHGGFGNDVGNGVAIDSQRNVVLAGYRGSEAPGTPQGQGINAYLRKHDKWGAFLCEREEMGTGTPPYPAQREVNDTFNGVVVDGQDNIVAAGTISGDYYSVGDQYYTGGYVNKYDSACSPVWAAPVKYKHPGDSAWQSLLGVALDQAGNIYPTGAVFAGWGGPEHEWATFKFSADGALQGGFPILYDFSPSAYYPDYSYDVAVDSLGNMIVAGVRGLWVNNAASYDWHVRKYDPAGTLLWSDTFSGAANLNDFAYRVAVDSDNNPIVAGYTNKGTNNGTGANLDWLVIKYAADGVASVGQRLWTRTYESATGKSEAAYGVAVNANDDVIVAGTLQVDASISNTRLALLAGSDGSVIGERIIADPANVVPMRVVWRAGSIAIGGYISRAAAPYHDMYVTLLAAPDVVSIVSAGPNPTAVASLSFTVTFTGPVTGVDATDFTLAATGLAGAAITDVSGSGPTWTVTVDTGAGEGTLRLDVVDDDTIVDAAGNPLGGAGAGNGDYATGEAYTVDRTSPVVSSVEFDSPNPTSQANVEYHVTFSEEVAGVDAADFAVTTTGLNGVSITEVSGSGTCWYVSVTTGSGNGTIRLDAIDDDSIADAAGNPLGGVGAGNGVFTAGDVYTVNKLRSHVSVGAYDGWILESSETSGKGGVLNTSLPTFLVGDDAANKQYVGVLHFDTSGLPDTAVVTAATLKVRKQGQAGTSPFTTHGALLMDIRRGFFGTVATVVAADFQAPASKAAVAKFGVKPIGNWYSAAVGSAGLASVNRSGTTQFRLRFTKDDNNDRGADYVNFYSGNAPAAARPQLIVQYYVP